MSAYGVGFLDLASLKPSEEIDSTHAARLASDLLSTGVLRQPILVERRHKVILDGHHRWRAASALALKRIPCILIDYDDPRLTLASWTSRVFTPDDVIAAGTTGRLLPRKSTRHTLDPPPQESPVSLDRLK